MAGRGHFTGRTFANKYGTAHVLVPGPKFGEFVRAASEYQDDNLTLITYVGAAVGAAVTTRSAGVSRERIMGAYQDAIRDMDPPLPRDQERVALDVVQIASGAGASIAEGMRDVIALREGAPK